MDSKYPQGSRLTKKEDSRKTKSTYTPSADTSSSKHQQSSTYQSQTGKKNQDLGGFWRPNRHRGHNHNFLAMGANTHVIKKDKKNKKDIF